MKIFLPILATILLLAPPAPGKEKPRVQVYYIPSSSMEPTLNINDRIWTTPVPYQKGDPKRGDIAIMELKTAEVAPWSEDKHKTVDFVMRVVAVPGDHVEITRRVLKLNGKIQIEPFVKWDDDYRYDMKVVKGLVYSRDYDLQGHPSSWTRMGIIAGATKKEQAAITRAKSEALPPHKYLVLGDHRSNSNDSHVFGLVDRATFRAKITMRLYPDPRTF